MSRLSGTGLLHFHSLILFLIFYINSRTVLSAPVSMPTSRVSILCTKKPSTTTRIPAPTTVKTVFETTFTTETDVVTKTVTDDPSRSEVEDIATTLTAVITSIQSGKPVVSDIGTEPGAVFTTSEYVYSTSGTLLTSTTFSRPAITMIVEPPVGGVVPTDLPDENGSSTSTSTSTQSSTNTEVPTSTSSIKSIEQTIVSTSVPLPESTTLEVTTVTSSMITSTTSGTPSMVPSMIIPIQTLDPTVESSTASTSTSTSLSPESTTLLGPSTTRTTSITSTSTTLPKTGYILTGIPIPQPSETPQAQSTRIILDGGVAMPSSTGGADLNGPPELVFRSGASSAGASGVRVWGVSLAVGVFLTVL